MPIGIQVVHIVESIISPAQRIPIRIPTRTTQNGWGKMAETSSCIVVFADRQGEGDEESGDAIMRTDESRAG